MLRRRQWLRDVRPRCTRSREQELDDGAGAALEIGRSIRRTGLDPLEQQAVQQRQQAARHGVDVEPGRELAREHALPQEELAGPGQPLATGRQHLADARLAIRLRPGLDERDLAWVAVV